MEPLSRYQALAPITHGNLTIFPVVSSVSHDTHEFLTLDDGLRSGEVVITEAGGETPLIRHRPGDSIPSRHHVDEDQVNTLMLVNNSKQPLILLAGEIVTGGKQDRIVGTDRIIAPESDADLGVFCVEPGRWTGTSAKFSANAYGGGISMVQPNVRKQAMANNDQQAVWDEVKKSKQAVSENVEVTAAAPSVAAQLAGTTSYARVMNNTAVREQVDKVAAPVMQSYAGIMRELRERRAVGVVVAINGQITWADIFAGTPLLEKYWPKLARSYAAEAVEYASGSYGVTTKDAQMFLDDFSGTHESVDSEPGVYRQREVSGDGYKVFELTSLLPETGFTVHIAKMAE
jgi:hypothetical protein